MNTRALSSETAERNESDDKFTYYANVVSLEEMASYKISTKIWRSYVSWFEPNDFKGDVHGGRGDICNLAFGLDYKYWHDTWSWAGELGLPPRLEERMYKCNDKVVNETRNWISHFRFEIMRSQKLGWYLIQHFDMDWCVWSPEGEIDYAKTAAKMVASPGMSNTNKSGLTRAQKFAIMANYCMEDEIKKFPPPPKNFVQAVNFNEDPLIFYWNCYRRKVLHNVPLGNHNSIDFVMALECCYKPWSVFEYFWNRLDANEQFVVAKRRLLVSSDGQERLLSKLPWSQQLRLIREMPVRIIIYFWLCSRLPEAALWAWRRTRDLLIAEDFAEIVMRIFDSSPNGEEICFLLEMWDEASEDFKKHVAENKDDAMAKYIIYNLREGPPNDKEFVFRFLSSKKVNSKKDFIVKNAVKFAVHVEDVHFMNDLITSCLRSSKDRSELKKSIIDSKEMMEHCKHLLCRSQFEDLRSMIEFYSSDADSGREFKQRLLNLEYGSWPYNLEGFVTEFEKWATFNDFVDEAYSNDEPSASSYKKRLVLSYVNDLNKNQRWSCSVNGAIKVVEWLYRDEELENMKRLLSNCFKNISTRGDRWRFLQKEFREFVSWCFSNDEKVLVDFKSAAPLDAIFDEALEELHGIYKDENEFTESILPRLSNLLMWLFSDEKKANKYKFDRISSLEELPIFAVLKERNDEPNLEILTKWYFNDDEAKIRKFRSKKLKTK